jgi:hypothetical protein
VILLSSAVENSTLLAERLSACPLPEVFRLDIIAGIAVRVVVVNWLLN